MDHLATDFFSAFARGDRKLLLPAALSVIIDGVPATMTVHAILRLLPRKRVVLQGLIDNQNVAIKLFVKNQSSARNIARELAGYAAVCNARVATPKLIGRFASACNQFEGLIYEFIDAATELGKCWPQFSDEQKKIWFREVMQASLALHCVGAYQQDIHLGNFLLQGSRLFLLDLGSIVIHEAPLAQKKCLINLGQLIAQLDVREHALAAPAIDNYFALSGWIDSIPLRNKLHRSIRHAWRRRLRDYLRKACRICSLTFFELSFRRLFAHRRGWEGQDIQSFLADPDRFMARGQLLKAGNTATVVKAEINARPVVIKRYNIKNWRHAIGRSLRPTRAQHSWLHAHMLELIGIHSLLPVALLEHRFGPLRGKAYFICEWIAAPDLLALGPDYHLNDDEADALQSLLLQMQTCRISHGDFKANNLLLDRGNIALIDLDAMCRYNSSRRFERAFHKDIARLLRNWPADSALHQQVAMLSPKMVGTNASPK
jgi:tRNA A-37 threonylcarbamoyl transferase component Bud32